MALTYLADRLLEDQRAPIAFTSHVITVFATLRDVRLVSAVCDVCESIVTSIAVAMHHLVIRRRLTDECQRN
jgi:hypothetical protein